jgi:5S rRNA maturation endonuclease (ribonuclease M5)
MPTKFYSYDDIKQTADCLDIARVIGLPVRDGRFPATWRGGKNETSVSANRDGWHDFATEESGSAIDLVALVRYNGDRQQAQEWLGDYLNLKPKISGLAPNPTAEKSRYQQLIDEGYQEQQIYTYTDEAGQPLHHVVRLWHPDHGKQFLQRAVDGRWSVKHIRTVLYNLPAILQSEWVIIVEGEKDADTLIRLGLPATTNAGGASKWKPEYSETLRGKQIVILPDNDEPGQRHVDLVAGHLVNIATSIRVITISQKQKGDVTDWLEQEGGTKERLLAEIQRSQPIDTRTIGEAFQIAKAKEANKIPFRNYTSDIDESSGVKKITKKPRHSNDMISDLYARFLGFPRKVGEELFDRDKDTGEIRYIRSTQELFSWIERKSKRSIDWARGVGYTAQDAFYAGVKAEAPRYEAISFVPDWPKRRDVYYCHPQLAEPSPNHHYFNTLVDFFNPTTPEYRILLKAFIAAPLYFESYIPRPLWVIESETAGAGKTTLATRTALLYGHPAIEVKTRDFARDMQEVTKRLVSAEGRQSRMLLIDNVVGTFASEELSAMVTMPHITGRPPYGRGEETRLNNLTYVITANNASIDNDLTIRSFFIYLKTLADHKETWNRELTEYICKNRIQILSDITDLLNNPPHIAGKPFTRFPEFECLILRAMCANTAEYMAVIETIAESRASANIEEEWGKTLEDLIIQKLLDLGLPPNQSAFIRSQVAEEWIKKVIPNSKNPVQTARNLARSGHCQRLHPAIKIYPQNGEFKRRGILWIGSDGNLKPRKIVNRIVDKTEVLTIPGQNDEI